jgi:hypothetical protein
MQCSGLKRSTAGCAQALHLWLAKFFESRSPRWPWSHFQFRTTRQRRFGIFFSPSASKGIERLSASNALCNCSISSSFRRSPASSALNGVLIPVILACRSQPGEELQPKTIAFAISNDGCDAGGIGLKLNLSSCPLLV